METASIEVTPIRRRNNFEKSTWKTHRYFVDFENRIHVQIFTSNRCHNFHVDSPFKIDVISTNFPRGISTSNRWRIGEDVSIGRFKNKSIAFISVGSVFYFILFVLFIYVFIYLHICGWVSRVLFLLVFFFNFTFKSVMLLLYLNSWKIYLFKVVVLYCVILL